MPVKTAATKTHQRIERLRALAGDGNPNEHEREVARHALDRMLERMTTAQRTEWTPNWQGEKYRTTRGMGMTEITKLIRDEVKLLRKLGKLAANAAAESAVALSEPIGDAPAEIKISISQPHYGSVAVKLTGIPQAWGWRWGKRNAWEGDTCERWIATDALEALGAELSRLGNVYNYDNSDVMTDYFDRRYYLNVNAAEPDSQWASHGVGHRH
jgi:hypothetical protein